MSTSSWATIASRNADKNPSNGTQQQQQPAPQSRPTQQRAPSPNPHYQPKSHPTSTSPSSGQHQDQETVYVLTLLTDKPHHDRMTALRTRYFPPRINKLAAHLTLFHALPDSHLASDIIPYLQHVASQTAPFRLHVSRPFRLKKGIALAVPKEQGGAKAQAVHRALLDGWKQGDWLSEQDAGGCRVHYTIMNKVDDEKEVAKALEEVKAEFQGDDGMAEGLGLWRYEKGWWRWERKFAFTGKGGV